MLSCGYLRIVSLLCGATVRLRHLLVILTFMWAMTCDFQHCGILTSVDSDEPVQPPFRRRNSKWCSVSSLTVIKYSSDKQRLWLDCAYAQADLRLCWSHIAHCWKSHALAHNIITWLHFCHILMSRVADTICAVN